MKASLLLSMFLCIVFNYLLSQNVKAGKSSIGQNSSLASQKHGNMNDLLLVKKCYDFDVTGKGDNTEWNKAQWNDLIKLDTGGRNYQSKFKILYSFKGIYMLFYGEDDRITTKPYNDFEAIYNGDVFEVFFRPNPQVPVYSEYEINQLDKQLILTLNKLGNQIYSWEPRNYNNDKDFGVKKKVNVEGEKSEVNAFIRSWSAELFFPFTILGLLPEVPPVSGATWSANFCRLDYDSGSMIKYSWTPTIQTSFHEIEKFRSIRFE